MTTRFITKNGKVCPINSKQSSIKRWSPIESVHDMNKRLIKRYKLQVGTVLKHKTEPYSIEIVYIHPLYGWVLAEYCDMAYIGHENLIQDMRNIDNFIVQK